MNTDWIHRNKPDLAQATSAAQQLNLTDALGEHARKLRRNCMTWSGLLFVLTYYRVPVKSVPIWNIQIPPDRAGTVLLIVAIPLVYSLVGFLIQAGADLLNWRRAHLTRIDTVSGNTLHRIADHLHILDMYVTGKYPAKPGLSEEEIRGTIENSLKAANDSAENVQRMHAHAKAVSRGRKIFAYGWEMFLPVAIAMIALIYASGALKSALVVLFEAPL